MFHGNFRLWSAIQTVCNDDPVWLREVLYSTFLHTDWTEDWIIRERDYLKGVS